MKDLCIALAISGFVPVLIGACFWGFGGMMPTPTVFAGTRFPQNWNWYDVVAWSCIGLGGVIVTCGLGGLIILDRRRRP